MSMVSVSGAGCRECKGLSVEMVEGGNGEFDDKYT